MISIGLHRVNLLSFEVGCCGLGFVNLCLRARQHVLGHQQEVGILASGDAASLVLDEHLLGDVDGQGLDGLLASDELLRPPGGTVLAVKYTSDSYLNDAEELNAAAVRQLYMDLFGEDTVGDEIHCYYDPDKSDFLYLDICYDAEVPLWNVIEMFQNKIPGMELSGEVLSLFYVHNRFDGHHDDLVATQEWLDTDPDDRNTTAGYYESIFDDREQEEFLDDAFYDDDTDGEED